MDLHPLSDIGSLTEAEIRMLQQYRVNTVESLYSRIQGKSREPLLQLLGRDETSYSLLEENLRRYLEKHNPGFLSLTPRPRKGTGALNPNEM